MSIRDLIRMRVEEGQLFHLLPVMDDDPVERNIFVTPEIQRLLDGPWENISMRKRCGRLRGDFESFIKGEVIQVCLTPYEADTAYMGRLDAPDDEVWDIRSRDPSPGLRVLGRFAETDVFIAMTCAPRSVPVDWLLREPLDDKNSKQWRDAIRQCKAIWRQLFSTYAPHTGKQVNDYVSKDFVPI